MDDNKKKLMEPIDVLKYINELKDETFNQFMHTVPSNHAMSYYQGHIIGLQVIENFINGIENKPNDKDI